MSESRQLHLESVDPESVRWPQEYEPVVGRSVIEELRRLSRPLQEKSWANVNSTADGGGVAEMLRGLVPLARGLGIDSHWHVLQGDEPFFRVTKKFHNMLQGKNLPLSLEEIFGAYLGTIDENARRTFITSDLVVIHDPQPAALVMNGVIYGNMLWRCHIDTSGPQEIVWRFLLPYINHCAGAIFTMPEFVGTGLQIPVYQIQPAIDPLCEKNRERTLEESQDTLDALFEQEGIDMERPILAAVSRYDIHKNQATLVRAFAQLKKEHRYDPRPQLVFLGNTASDDPEGLEVLEDLQKLADGDPDIFFFVNVPDNDAVVGSLLRVAAGFLHVSTREGFGLVVSEALWQGTPVVGSRVGGIAAQILDGETGRAVDPLDISAIAEAMHELLTGQERCVATARKGKELVRRQFLVTEQMRRYLCLLRYYSHIDRRAPEFRLSELTYSEVLGAMRPRPPYFP
ncbi:glycosyltransferase [Desulfobaculum bizertense]|uniref:Trehalose synthase n=1 Tax=Desulfobaculum bizertense DSM 18034 TaxID=1121442 RepID=A0A1T4VP03_9BACT|nr:glycosyltransferase [Desulfobaculum bizertense]SKA66625.1 trehalose synthase [Desulfobaculum bizertense DSM 18034]